MRFLIDAGLPPWMVETFAEVGLDAIHAETSGLAHAADTRIGEEARRTGRAIVTRDFDFSDVRTFVPRRFHGIVVLVIPRHRGSPYKRLLLLKFFDYFRGVETLSGKLVIVEIDRIRVRR